MQYEVKTYLYARYMVFQLITISSVLPNFSFCYVVTHQKDSDWHLARLLFVVEYSLRHQAINNHGIVYVEK